MVLTKLFNDFFNSEKASGFILVILTFFSLLLSNSPWQHNYAVLWNLQLAQYSITHWINDGLMAIFFLLIGLELEREIYNGELSNLKTASLPVIGALGGMLVPAGIYFAFNLQTGSDGAGIPMTTDIAFAVGIMSLAGPKIPSSLKIFLTALAVIDDLGGIIVIAIFYSSSLAWGNLLVALGIFILLLILNRLKVHNLIPYLAGGIVMWYFMLHSGIHASITGILLAFAIPFGDGGKRSPSYILQHFLHKPVAFIILPLFAMANTCINLGTFGLTDLFNPNSLGILTGLVIGKPLGICLFAALGVSLGICSLPTGLDWKNIIGAGILGGIGFTMSIFITLLAFDDANIVNSSKIIILIASLIAGTTGYLVLKFTLKDTSDRIG